MLILLIIFCFQNFTESYGSGQFEGITAEEMDAIRQEAGGSSSETCDAGTDWEASGVDDEDDVLIISGDESASASKKKSTSIPQIKKESVIGAENQEIVEVVQVSASAAVAEPEHVNDYVAQRVRFTDDVSRGDALVKVQAKRLLSQFSSDRIDALYANGMRAIRRNKRIAEIVPVFGYRHLQSDRREIIGESIVRIVNEYIHYAVSMVRPDEDSQSIDEARASFTKHAVQEVTEYMVALHSDSFFSLINKVLNINHNSTEYTYRSKLAVCLLYMTTHVGLSGRTHYRDISNILFRIEPVTTISSETISFMRLLREQSWDLRMKLGNLILMKSFMPIRDAVIRHCQIRLENPERIPRALPAANASTDNVDEEVEKEAENPSNT